LLPRLKAEGKTIVAVTHDDRFFHIADRRLHMEDGQLHDVTEIQSNG
jgi:putative ATP-binding cassette transporter